jgi:hypothetical protein
MIKTKLVHKETGISLDCIFNNEGNISTCIIEDFYQINELLVNKIVFDIIHGLKVDSYILSGLCIVSKELKDNLINRLIDYGITNISFIEVSPKSNSFFYFPECSSFLQGLINVVWDPNYSFDSIYFLLGTGTAENKKKFIENVEEIEITLSLRDPFSVVDNVLINLCIDYNLIVTKGHDGNSLKIATSVFTLEELQLIISNTINKK